jgi:hypothetical protein
MASAAPCILAPFTALAPGCMRLCCCLPTRPTAQPLMGFVFLKSQVCFRLPPAPSSRRRPCLPLTVAATNLRTGLSPTSQRPCWAHKQDRHPRKSGVCPLIREAAFFCLPYRGQFNRSRFFGCLICKRSIQLQRTTTGR